MKLILAICFIVFGIIHLWNAFTTAKLYGEPAKRILGMRVDRLIHFAAGIFLVLLGLLLLFGLALGLA